MWRARAHLGRTSWRRADAAVRLLLVIGTPGTGKRAVGHYLEQVGGFLHLDLEDAGTRRRFLDSGTGELRAEIETLAGEGRGLVVTWAPGSADQLRHVRRLRSLGFDTIWFDGDRGAACPAHFVADGRSAAGFRFVDSFEPDGRFRPVEAVVGELLAPHPRPERRPARDLLGAAVRLLPRPQPAPAGVFAAGVRLRVGGGLALAAGIAAAAAVLVPGLHGGASAPAHVAASGPAAVHAKVASLPRNGVLVSGRSLAGVSLGDTMAQVRALWGPGRRIARCYGCKRAIWYFAYPNGEAAGAGVQFRSGRVVAVFTLGNVRGWRTDSGIRVGQLLESPVDGAGDTSVWKSCTGYGAKSTRTTPGTVTSILTQGVAVYGFALTRPSVSPCV